MFVQYVYDSWQMEEPLIGTNIRLYGEKSDKLFMLQLHLFVRLTNTSWIPLSQHCINQYLQTSLWARRVTTTEGRNNATIMP